MKHLLLSLVIISCMACQQSNSKMYKLCMAVNIASQMPVAVSHQTCIVEEQKCIKMFGSVEGCDDYAKAIEGPAMQFLTELKK